MSAKRNLAGSSFKNSIVPPSPDRTSDKVNPQEEIGSRIDELGSMAASRADSTKMVSDGWLVDWKANGIPELNSPLAD